MPFHSRRGQVKDDVSAASAAFTLTILDELVKQPKVEQFERLKLHYHAAISAFVREHRRVYRKRKPSLPKPSVN